MRSTSSITRKGHSRVATVGSLFLVIFGLMTNAAGQRLAVIVPDRNPASDSFASAVVDTLSKNFDVQDPSMSDAAYRAVAPRSPFNMSAEEAKTVGSAIGCDYLILVRSETLRRSSFEKPEYYESFAALFTVSAKTGKLEDWRNISSEGPKPDASVRLLERSASATVAELAKQLQRSPRTDPSTERAESIEELPPENSAVHKNFRAPVPFARIKPVYTELAYMYAVTATVEIELDLDATGKISRTSIVRWAGYGLDESVETAVRKMNWRPAERNGKPLAMRVLLRYNFKKIDK